MSKPRLITIERPKGTRKKGKKNRKHGRNKKKGEAYKKAHKHEKSHVRRLLKHLARYSGDEQAREALRRYEELLF